MLNMRDGNGYSFVLDIVNSSLAVERDMPRRVQIEETHKRLQALLKFKKDRGHCMCREEVLRTLAE